MLFDISDDASINTNQISSIKLEDVYTFEDEEGKFHIRTPISITMVNGRTHTCHHFEDAYALLLFLKKNRKIKLLMIRVCDEVFKQEPSKTILTEDEFAILNRYLKDAA